MLFSAEAPLASIFLEHLWYLFTAFRKIPPFGLHGTSIAPKTLTYRYTVILPIQGWEQALTYTIKFGVGGGGEGGLERFNHCIVCLMHYKLESRIQTI